MDMRYHWLTDRVRQKKLTFIGHQGVKILETITQNITQHNITTSQGYAWIDFTSGKKLSGSVRVC
jgi:hypothetical protein